MGESIQLQLTPAMEKGESSVWQCAWCGSLAYNTRGAGKPSGPCPVCITEDFAEAAGGWLRQDVPVGPFREPVS